MIGHQQVIALRQKGYKPSCVFFDIGTAPPGSGRDVDEGVLPSVWTDGKFPVAADLRFLRGLRVHVVWHGGSREMFWRWWDAVVEAAPAHAITVEPDGEVIEWRAS